MRCWNCGKDVPDDAKACVRCEADLSDDPPSDSEIAAVADILAQMPGDLQDLLREHAGASTTADEFADRILVGSCPECGSENTGTCEHDPDYEDITLGRCFDCGKVWCTHCEHVLGRGEKVCPRAEEHEREWGEIFDDPDEQ